MNVAVPHPLNRANLSWGSNQAFFYGAMIYLFTFLVDGPIRYSLEAVGGSILVYFRDAIPLLMLGVVLCTACLTGKIGRPLLFILGVLTFFTMVAIVYVANALQILFSLKIILPFLAGLVCYRELLSDERRLMRFMWLYFLVALVGVYLNGIFKFPWAGLSYEIGGIAIEGGFEHNTSGFDRLSGFSRTNFEAATQIMLLIIYIASFARGKGSRIVQWIAAGGAIVLTTTKGIIGVYVVLSLFFAAYVIVPRLHKLYRVLLIVPIGAMVLLPLTLPKMDIDISDPVQVGMYASVADRVVNGWPPVFENVRGKGSIITGRGVGGTGAGEYYFANEAKGAADNMFVYLYAWFGLFSVVLLGLLYWKSQRLNILSRREDLCVFLWLVSILSYGIAANIIESAFFAFFFGLCVARISRVEGENRLFVSP